MTSQTGSNTAPWACVIIVGGAMGIAALNGTSSVAAEKPSGYELSREWTNAGPAIGKVIDVANAEAVHVSTPTSANLVAELRRISGLTWQHLARLFNVDRRAVHFWASGRPMSDANAEHLSKLVAMVRPLYRGVPARVRDWLLAPMLDGESPFELLAKRQYDRVMVPEAPGAPPKRPPAVAANVSNFRRPLPLQQLIQGEVRLSPASGRLLASKPIKVKRSE